MRQRKVPPAEAATGADSKVDVILDEPPGNPLWMPKCSVSTLVGLLMWVVVGVWVYSLSLNGQPDALIQDPRKVEGCRPQDCTKVGAEPFGTLLGAHQGVFGFSNCNPATCISLVYSTLNVTASPQDAFPDDVADFLVGPTESGLTLRSGMKWQCVEYARRYWMLAGQPRPAFFGSVVGAEDIWTQLTTAYYLDGSETPLYKHINKVSTQPPQSPDLIVYPRDGPNGEFPYGHVAVVVGVEKDKVYVAEQNWASQPWPGPFHNYTRVLNLSRSEETGAYELVDGKYSILGWMRYH